MSDDAINVKITADVGGLVGGMDEAAAATKSATDDVKANLDELAHGATEAGEPLEGLTEKFREFATEQRQEGRLAGFMASQFQAMGFGAKSAASEVTGLIGAFAISGGLGVGIELVKIAIEKFNELSAEERKSADEIKKLGDDSAAAVKKFVDELKLAEEQSGKTGTALKLVGAEHPLKNQVEEAEAEVAAARVAKVRAAKLMADTQAELAKTVDQRTSGGAIGAFSGGISAAREAMEAAQKAEDEAVEKRYLAKHELKAMDTAAAPVVKKENDDAANDAAKKAADEQVKIHDQELTQLNKFNDQEDAAIQKHLDAGVKAWQEAEAKKHAAEIKRIDAGLEAEQIASKEAERLEKERLDNAIAREKRLSDAESKALAGWKKDHAEEIEAAKRFSNQLGEGLASVVEGSKTVKQAATDMAKSVVSDLIRMATTAVEQEIIKEIGIDSVRATAVAAARAANITTVTADAGVAGAGAAASVAPTPFIGPALAAAAMAETSALVLASMLPLASAAGGMDVGSSGGTMIYHPHEMMLPERYANVIRDMADDNAGGSSRSGGSGGQSGRGEVHLHFNAPVFDAGGIRALPTHPDFVRGLREAQRNGVL